MKTTSKNEDDLKNEADLKKEDDLKNEEDFKNVSPTQNLFTPPPYYNITCLFSDDLSH